MASERQIAANRANAQKSTGPRSCAGKKRVSRNAFRHGLSVGFVSSAVLAEKTEQLARQFAGDSTEELVMACVWRDNLDENGATIWMRRGGRAEG